jgi:hypothetical protein
MRAAPSALSLTDRIARGRAAIERALAQGRDTTRWEHRLAQLEAQYAAQQLALERKNAENEFRLEFLHRIRVLMEQRGDCVVGDVLEDAVTIWDQRHPGVRPPLR